MKLPLRFFFFFSLSSSFLANADVYVHVSPLVDALVEGGVQEVV